MPLADIGLLSRDDVQLLSDSLQPVFVLELTSTSESLIRRGLLRSFTPFGQDSERVCFVLETTDRGAACVAEWIEDPINLCVCETCAKRGQPNEPVYKMGICTFCYHGKTHPKATPKQLKRDRMGTPPGWVGFLVLAFALLVSTGCGFYSAPRLIEADGASYVACSGVVHVSSDGGLFGSETTYSISFTNDDNIDTVVKGVRNVTITRIPTIASSLQTHLPDLKTDTDKNSSPFVEGSTFLSGPGGKMLTFRNGVWVPDTACQGPK